MNIAVVLCSKGRPTSLHETVQSVLAQTKLPQIILISSPNVSNIAAETLRLPLVSFIKAPLGLCHQRNCAIDVLSPAAEIVAFLDDDVELTPSYLSLMNKLFEENKDVIVASGHMLHDGGRGSYMSREAALDLCRAHEQPDELRQQQTISIIDSGYGCNMLVRRSAIGTKRFDENLPLYAWLEDRDFSVRCAREGVGAESMVELQGAALVHLGSRAAKVSGVRLGFSTIVNPLYLHRRSRIFSLRYVVVNYWLRCLVGNVLGLLARDPDYDRLGLLKGNIIGLFHVVTGRCDPTYILKL